MGLLGDPNISGAGGNGGYTEGCRVKANANQSIPNATWTSIAFTAEDYDIDDMHDNATNNTRITIKTAGIYDIKATVRVAAGTGGMRFIWLYLNGTTPLDGGIELNPTAADSAVLKIATNYELAVNDYLEVQMYQNSGGAKDVRYSNAYSPIFMAQRIG